MLPGRMPHPHGGKQLIVPVQYRIGKIKQLVRVERGIGWIDVDILRARFQDGYLLVLATMDCKMRTPNISSRSNNATLR